MILHLTKSTNEMIPEYGLAALDLVYTQSLSTTICEHVELEFYICLMVKWI